MTGLVTYEFKWVDVTTGNTVRLTNIKSRRHRFTTNDQNIINALPQTTSNANTTQIIDLKRQILAVNISGVIDQSVKFDAGAGGGLVDVDTKSAFLQLARFVQGGRGDDQCIIYYNAVEIQPFATNKGKCFNSVLDIEVQEQKNIADVNDRLIYPFEITFKYGTKINI